MPNESKQPSPPAPLPEGEGSRPRLILVGGFLGAGKTTLLAQAACA